MAKETEVKTEAIEKPVVEAEKVEEPKSKAKKATKQATVSKEEVYERKLRAINHVEDGILASKMANMLNSRR